MYFSFNGINALTHSAIEPQVQPESDIKFYWKKHFLFSSLPYWPALLRRSLSSATPVAVGEAAAGPVVEADSVAVAPAVVD